MEFVKNIIVYPPRHIGKFEFKQYFIFLPSLLRPELIKGNGYEA